MRSHGGQKASSRHLSETLPLSKLEALISYASSQLYGFLLPLIILALYLSTAQALNLLTEEYVYVISAAVLIRAQAEQ